MVAPLNIDPQIMHAQQVIPNRGDDESARSNGLRITETFVSLQGEGLLTGTQSFFIRTSGCNLRCWFCDTPYASWQPEGHLIKIESLVQQALQSGCDHVVLTGGEPMLPAGCVDLVGMLRSEGLHVTIETAGTVYRSLTADLMSISPKLPGSGPGLMKMSSGEPTALAAGSRIAAFSAEIEPIEPLASVPSANQFTFSSVQHQAAPEHQASNQQPSGSHWSIRHEQTRWRPEVIAGLIQSAIEYQIKFVVDAPADFDKCLAAVSALEIPADHVWIMPQGIDAATLDRQSQWLAPRTTAAGFRYCDRMHVRWYGNRRGT